MANTTLPASPDMAKSEPGFVRAIGLFDGTMIVVGSMIGSGIFITSAESSRPRRRRFAMRPICSRPPTLRWPRQS